MVVQHNLTSMNANRQLGITTSAQAKSSEKLSSGYKINRAADDAAGLTISEKMRSQIRGLDTASSNAQDGISLIQSAEGALTETHSILQRMNELAVQGANDTNTDIDRDAINDELTALTSEIDRISTDTQFNKQNLLDGTYNSKELQVGANTNQKISISIDNMNARSLGLRDIESSKLESATSIVAMKYGATSITYTAGTTTSAAQNSLIDAVKSTAKASTFDATTYVQRQDTSSGSLYYASREDDSLRFAAAASAAEADLSIYGANASTAITDSFGTYTVTSTTNAATSTTDTGIARVDDYKVANTTLSAVQTAINQVSKQRSALGALQNRLEHTVANLDSVSENTSSAESRIRDTDMAEEMVDYSKNNILTQAGQSMLAQANQSTQGVLSLLQ